MSPAERTELADLAEELGAAVLFEAPLADFTTWRIGGPAEALFLPYDRAALLAGVALARARGWPLRVMGNGSNLLVPDEGVRGVVVNPTSHVAEVTLAGDRVTAEAGAFLPKLARTVAAAGLSGLECVAGVPGTIGGGCVLNAGVPGATLGDVLVAVEILDETGAIRRVPATELALGHRQSRLQTEPWLVLSAELALTPGEPADILAAMEHHLEYRRRTQPLREATCGSVFRRPPGDYPGRLIEAAGGKGLRVGGAEVSGLHANWIINRGGATAAEVKELMARLVDLVRAHSGVELVPEVIIWEP